MKLVEVNMKIKCDMPNCKNMAVNKVIKPGFLKNAGLFLCKECIKEMYSAIGSCIVPKSPSNMLNKKISTKRTKSEVNE